MAKNGYRIFDADTHVGPNMDNLEPYLSTAEKQALESVSQYRRGKRYMVGERKYDRRLGDAEPQPADPNAYMGGRFTGAHRDRRPNPQGDYDPAARIADLDFEGVDVNLTLPSGWFGCWTEIPDTAIENSMYRAYNRWMADYCSAYPDRLTGTGLYAFVEAGEAQDCGEEELASYLAGAIGRDNAPKYVQVVPALPRNAAGSIRTDILQLIATNQVDSIDPLITSEAERATVDRILNGRHNMRDRFVL